MVGLKRSVRGQEQSQLGVSLMGVAVAVRRCGECWWFINSHLHIDEVLRQCGAEISEPCHVTGLDSADSCPCFAPVSSVKSIEEACEYPYRNMKG
jgi:hypothetical protein